MTTNKKKGTIGELKVATELIKKGYYVFTEITDASPIDIVAINVSNPEKTLRIQVKSTEVQDGYCTVTLMKSNKFGIKYYSESNFDIFAVYVENLDKIYYITLAEAFSKSKKVFTVRVDPPKSAQIKRINFGKNYEDLNAVVAQLVER